MFKEYMKAWKKSKVFCILSDIFSTPPALFSMRSVRMELMRSLLRSPQFLRISSGTSASVSIPARIERCV